MCSTYILFVSAENRNAEYINALCPQSNNMRLGCEIM
jgi:hypothetical protein